MVDIKGKGKSSTTTTNPKYGFGTLAREKRFANPSQTSHDVPELEELVAPHIDSFDALFDDGSGKGKGGLLDLAVKDLKSKVVFDGKGKDQGKLGNRLESKADFIRRERCLWTSGR